LNPNNLTFYLIPIHCPWRLVAAYNLLVMAALGKIKKSITQQNMAVLLQNKSVSAWLTENGQGKNNHINLGRKITQAIIAFNKGGVY